MGSDADHPADPRPFTDTAEETAFLREVAFSPPMSPPGAPLVQPGDTVGRFRIERLVGRGGMGVVYAARDLTLGRMAALKLLTGGQIHGGDQEQCLLREAKAAARVSHPNLATLFDIGHADGLVFIAMELVEGRTLRAVLQACPTPLADAARIAREMARGLAAIHAARLVHRDIKPENVIIADDGTVKLLDFGLAELGVAAGPPAPPIADDTSTLARRWVGTPGYMSPEQARGMAADARSDVFSFGIVLYEMLAGKRPFHGATANEVLLAIVHDARSPLPMLSDGNLTPLLAVVERCLSKEAGDRYADASALASALNEVTTSAAPTTEHRAPRLKAGWRAVAVATALLAVGGLALQHWQGAARPARTGSILDLPLPHSTSGAAITAYKSAIQSFHDSNWGQAELSLREALRVDPTLGIAHLRLALIMSYEDYTAAEAKAAYRKAMGLRSTLSPRDRGLLDALEPLLNADPVDLAETVRRLADLTERHPRDAELFHLLGIYRRWEGPEGQLVAARLALAIDPDYPDAWAAVAEASVDRDPATSIAALDRCISLAPTAADCRMLRATVESALGRCVEAEQQIRRATDDPHASEHMFLLRARFLYALGNPREAIADAFRQRWARLEADAKLEDILYDSALVAAAYGDFTTAKSKAEEGLRLIDTQATLRAHARFMLLLADVELESGRTVDAAAVASSFLARRNAWQRGLPGEDPTVYLTRIVARAGELSDPEMRARRDAWYRRAREMVAGERTLERRVWLLAYAQGIERSGEAREALAARSEGDRGTMLDDALEASLGRALWLSGSTDEALPYLARAHDRCDRLAVVMSSTRSDLLYGHALEARGDRAGACGVYRSILQRWGSATPRSVTADAARGRSEALGCR